jgi:amino acid permease
VRSRAAAALQRSHAAAKSALKRVVAKMPAPPPAASASLASTTTTMLANLAGAGLLSLPYTLRRCGLIPGVCALVLIACVNGGSALLLARCAELAGGGSRAAAYKDLAVAALGGRAGAVVAATLAVYTLGSCVSFAVLLGDFLPELLDAALAGACGGGGGGGGGRCAAARAVLSRAPVSVALAGGAFLYPLALLRNLDGLRFTSAASAVCTVYTCVLLLALCAAGPRAPAAELNVRGGGAGLFIALPILLVAFTMHYNVPRLFAEMKGDAAGGKLRRFGVAVAGAFCAALVIYASGALGGYLLIGAATKGDILENFAAGDAPIIVARVALSVVVTACYPLAFNAMRAAVTSLLPARCARRLAAPADARTHASDDDEEVAVRDRYDGRQVLGLYVLRPSHGRVALPALIQIRLRGGRAARECERHW